MEFPIAKKDIAAILDQTGVAYRWGGTHYHNNIFPPSFEPWSDEDRSKLVSAIEGQGWSVCQTCFPRGRGFESRQSSGVRISAWKKIPNNI